MERQSKKERKNNDVNCIIYDHDACCIWKDIWICTESNLGDHKDHVLHCSASAVFGGTGIYGSDVDRISGAFNNRNCIVLCVQKLNHWCVEEIVIC